MLQGFPDEPEVSLARLEKQQVKKTREGTRYQRDQKDKFKFHKEHTLQSAAARIFSDSRSALQICSICIGGKQCLWYHAKCNLLNI